MKNSLNLITPLNQLSYGIVATNILRELINREIKVSVFPIGPIDVDPKYHNSIKQALTNSNTFRNDVPTVRIFHQFSLAETVGKGLFVGFPIFELDTFNPVELHHLHNCDRLFVCSDWAKDVVKDNFYNSFKYTSFPIKVVPLGVDTTLFTPSLSKRKPTIFLVIGKNEKRKGHDVIVDWFNKAFTEEDDVELWVMWENPFYTSKQNTILNLDANYSVNTKLGRKIKIIPRQQRIEDVVSIMHQTDCVLCPSRGEGWNLELLEMLACGKWAIATNYSGHTEFCTHDAVKLVGVHNFEKAMGRPGLDDKWFNKNTVGNWASLDGPVENEFINSMRSMHELKQSGKLGMNEAGIEVGRKFSWRNAVDCFLSGLE